MKCKVYLSDEGFGHIVRQRAVLEALRSLRPDIQYVVQTHQHLSTAKKYIPFADFIDRFNNIVWHKKDNGSPDSMAIARGYADYPERSDEFIQRELAEFDYDFVISDFVFEAFEIAMLKGVPAFGVAHFTWDWFFSKIYPPAVSSDLIHRFIRQVGFANRLYFPPFTPDEILTHYGEHCFEVPLIMKKEVNHKTVVAHNEVKIMIADSGAGVLARSIQKALMAVEGMTGFRFFVSDKFQVPNANVGYIPQDQLMIDYISDMDLVIGRAGFNTISECIGMRTPMLLLGEALNPEMSENLLQLKKGRLASFISMATFEHDLHGFLPQFMQHEYPMIKKAMNEHRIETNGAEVIARDILSRL